MADTTTVSAPASTAAADTNTPPPASTAEKSPTPETTTTTPPEGGSNTASDIDFDSITDPAMLEKILESANQEPTEDETQPETERKPEAQKTEAKPKTEEQTTTTQPENNDEDQAALADPTKLPKNFRFHTEDPKQQRFLKLMKQNPDKSPAELLTLAGYDIPKGETKAATEATTEETTAARVEPTAPTSQRITESEAKVTELTEKLKKAEENYEPTAGILSDLQDAKLDLREAKQEARAYEQHAQVFESHRRTSIAEAHKLSPESSKEGTPQYEEIQREVAWLDQHKPELLETADYPLAVLKRVAARRPELFPNVGKPATTAVKQDTQKPAPPARLAKGDVESGSATAATQPLTPAEALKKVDEMSLEELEAIANMTGEKRR